MNKLNKIGVSALCGSLAAISAANAGDLSATGGANLTYLTTEGQTDGNPIGMASNVTFTGSGDLENGWSVAMSIAGTDGGGYSNTNITIGIPSIGDIRIDQGTSGTGIQRMDDMTPSVWEEADGAGISAGINKIAGTSAGSTVEITPSAFMPAGLTARLALSPDADSGNTNDKATGGSTGAQGSGWDLTLSAGSELTGVDGLTVYAGVSMVEQYQNAASVDGDQEEKVVGFTYVGSGMMDRISVGASITKEDTGVTGTTEYENQMYGLTFKVSDELSIGYNHIESDESGQDLASPSAESLQVAYTMGGASFRIAEVKTKNSTYSTAASADTNGTVISMGLAF
jgi:outer membrane protein OmpU